MNKECYYAFLNCRCSSSKQHYRCYGRNMKHRLPHRHRERRNQSKPPIASRTGVNADGSAPISPVEWLVLFVQHEGVVNVERSTSWPICGGRIGSRCKFSCIHAFVPVTRASIMYGRGPWKVSVCRFQYHHFHHGITFQLSFGFSLLVLWMFSPCWLSHH